MSNPTDKQAVRPNVVIVVTPDGKHRTEISETLMQKGGYQVFFLADLDKIIEQLLHLRAGVVIHDWDAFDRDPCSLLHQRVTRHPEMVAVLRLVFTASVSNSLIAVAADTSIDRIISRTAVKLSLVEEIQMARSGRAGYTELQEKVREIQRGEADYSQNEVDTLVAKAYDIHPYDPVVKLEFGQLNYRKQRLQKSMGTAKEILVKDPQNVRAMGLVSRILMKQGQLDEAFAFLERANILSPKNSQRLLSMGDIVLKKGDKAKAREYYQEAVENDPDATAGASEKLGLFELEEGNANDALDIFRQAMSEEEVAGLLNNNGILAARKGEYEESLKFYDLAVTSLKTNKYVPHIYFNMALANKNLKNLEEARKLLKRALKYNPSFTKAEKMLKDIEKKL
ncbi:MAG: tetratricopeptide repeat protein [Zetaproteobacteria bacterium]|nr:tetratricopeptide repeat protein [Zetaproteobacteria bacterium]